MAEIVVYLCESYVPRLGHAGLPRCMALELSVEDGSWDVAQKFEVLKNVRSALATDKERMRGSRR